MHSPERKKRADATAVRFKGEKENAPSRLLPRPAFRLTFAEAIAGRRTFNLRNPVLGA
jgi:hypothetical protein